MKLGLKPTELAVSAIYGAVDIAADVKGPGTLPVAYTTLTRAGGFLGGLAIAAFGKGKIAEVGETLVIASLPLFERELYDRFTKKTSIIHRSGLVLRGSPTVMPQAIIPVGLEEQPTLF